MGSIIGILFGSLIDAPGVGWFFGFFIGCGVAFKAASSRTGRRLAELLGATVIFGGLGLIIFLAIKCERDEHKKHPEEPSPVSPQNAK